MPKRKNRKSHLAIARDKALKSQREAAEAASLQDGERRYSDSTRMNVNSYGGGATAIRDIGVIERRRGH